MKIRSSHIALAIIAVVVAIGVSAFQRTKPGASQEMVAVAVTIPASDSAPDMIKDTAYGTSDEKEETADGTSDAAPSIWIKTQDLDFGLISRERKSYTEFPIYNRGNKPLHIGQIKTTCNCTRGIMTEGNSVIAPGESENMQIVIDPALIGGFESTKILTIFSNDPKYPKLQMKVSAHLDPELEAIPASVKFGKIAQGSSPEATVLLRQLTGDPLEVIRILENPGKTPKPDSGNFIYAFERRPEETWKAPGMAEYEIKVKVSSKLGKGEHKQHFFAMLKEHRLRAIRVIMTVEVY